MDAVQINCMSVNFSIAFTSYQSIINRDAWLPTMTMTITRWMDGYLAKSSYCMYQLGSLCAVVRLSGAREIDGMDKSCVGACCVCSFCCWRRIFVKITMTNES